MSVAASQRLRLFLHFAVLLPLPLLVFLFACRGLDEADFWWHVRGGQWILETGRLPDTDPFSYASADQRWIDIYWLFQIVLALTYARGAAAGVIVLGAALAALSVLAGLIASLGKSVNASIVALCWIAGILILGLRLPLRPELVTLLFIAADLAILKWAEKRPRLVWALPVIQLIWVNCHGLFIFGPILAAFWWIDFEGRRLIGRLSNQPGVRPSRDMMFASAAVVLACFVNPYGVSGATLPITLYPKVSGDGNPYREHIAELHSPAHFFAKSGRAAEVKGQPPELLDRSFSTRLMFLLVPLSFLVPTALRLSKHIVPKQPAKKTETKPLAGTRAGPIWIAVFAGAVGVSIVDAAVGSWQSPPPSVELLRLLAPCLFLIAGGAGYLVLPNKSAKAFSVASGIAMSLWVWWLEGYFAEAASGTAGAILTPLALFLVVMILRTGGNLFALLLGFSFGFLALGALYNLGRFGLVGAVVLSWNLGDFAAEIRSSMPQPRRTWLGPAVETALGAALWLWFGAALAGMAVPGLLRPDAFQEPPFLFPHDAARFAGRPGMPPRVLAYGFPAANVFVFHNGPECKVFIDARLEVPTEATFLAYRDLEEKLITGNPRWVDALSKIGNPVLLLEHKQQGYSAEATVLAHPSWRLVYFDPLAAIFVPRGDADRDLERQFPTVDFAARHFASRRAAADETETNPAALEKESIALGNLGLALCRSPDATWNARIPVLLAALDRARKYESERGEATAGLLFSLGTSCWALQPDSSREASPPKDGWVAFSDVRWSQLTHALRQAGRLDAGDTRSVADLYKVFRTRGLADAQRGAGLALLETGSLDARDGDAVREQISRISPPADLARISPHATEQTALEFARAGRPEDATRLAESVGESAWSLWGWPAIDALADAWMRLGDPGRARHAWRQAKPASEPVRQARVAATFWVERDLAAAAKAYEAARKIDPKLAEAHWALAWINTERGLAEEAMADCRKALDGDLPEPMRSELTALAAFLRGHLSGGSP